MATVFYEEIRAKRVLQRLHIAGFPYRWAANPYMGCRHPCAYCYARGSHRYRGHEGGQDMEQRVIVKVNAAEALREQLQSLSWTHECIILGAGCDPYQAAELKYRITRRMLELCLELGQPVCLTTKSTLLLRDVDLLRRLVSLKLLQVYVRICSLSDAISRHVEPEAALPEKRLQMLERLVQAGVPAGVLVAPVLPDLNDRSDHLEELLQRARNSGAQQLWCYVPFLKPGGREWTFPYLREQYPHLATQYKQHYRGDHDAEHYAEEIARVVGELGERYGFDQGTTMTSVKPHPGQLLMDI